MNRRSMLGMLGIGAAAGPAVVSEAVRASVPWEQSTVQTHGIGYSIAKETYDNAWNPVEALAAAKREYSMMTEESSKWIADYISREMDEYINGYGSYHYDRIDADIRNMKSFSESAKMRMFIERKARRRYEQSKSSLFSRIQELMVDKA